MIPDPELRWASARAYNDWLAETFTAASTRFAGAAMIPVQEIDSAVEEIERVAPARAALDHAADAGARGRAVQPRSSTTRCGRRRRRTACRSASTSAPARAVDRARARGRRRELRRGRVSARSARSRYLAASGVLERFPELHVVMVECGAGWLAWLLERMDEAFEEHAAWVKPKLAEPPSFYVRRQGHVTFGNDAAGRGEPRASPASSRCCGRRTTRTPRARGPTPRRRSRASSTASTPSERRRVTYETTARLYGLQAPTASTA